MLHSGPSFFASPNDSAAERVSAEAPESRRSLCRGGCERCVFWLESTGCCRRDCDRFGERTPVESCPLWRPLGKAEAVKRHRLIATSRPWEEQSPPQAA